MSKSKTESRRTPECKHDEAPKLWSWDERVQKKLAAGEDQLQCPFCRLWIWESLYWKQSKNT